MPIYAKVSGEWKEVVPWIKVGGLWTVSKLVWAKANNLWEVVYHPITVSGHVESVAASSGPLTAKITFDEDGFCYDNSNNLVNSGTDWIRPAALAGTPFEIRATVQDGALTGGDLDGVWLSLTQSREWFVTQNGAGFTFAQLLIEIRANGAVLASGTYDLIAEVVAG